MGGSRLSDKSLAHGRHFFFFFLAASIRHSIPRWKKTTTFPEKVIAAMGFAMVLVLKRLGPITIARFWGVILFVAWCSATSTHKSQSQMRIDCAGSGNSFKTTF